MYILLLFSKILNKSILYSLARAESEPSSGQPPSLNPGLSKFGKVGAIRIKL